MIIDAVIGPKADQVAFDRVEFHAVLALNEKAVFLRHERPFHGAALELDQLLVARQINREDRDWLSACR